MISFSHFVPDQRLLPEKRYLTFPNLAKAAGSLPLGARVRALAPDIHVFGHTHFAWDAKLPLPLPPSSSLQERIGSSGVNDAGDSRKDGEWERGEDVSEMTRAEGKATRYIQAPLCYPKERAYRSE